MTVAIFSHTGIKICTSLSYGYPLPWCSANARGVGSIPGLGGFPWRREWLPTLVFLLGKSHEQRSLVGYSPWDHQKSQTRLSD